MSLQLACALSGQLRSFVNAAGPLLDSPSPDDEKLARSFWIYTASVRLFCAKTVITRGAIERSYLYICMGHTTYMHLNRQCRIVRPKEAIGHSASTATSLCALKYILSVQLARTRTLKGPSCLMEAAAHYP